MELETKLLLKTKDTLEKRCDDLEKKIDDLQARVTASKILTEIYKKHTRAFDKVVSLGTEYLVSGTEFKQKNGRRTSSIFTASAQV